MFLAALQRKNERSEQEGSFEKKFLFLNEGKLAKIAGTADLCDNGKLGCGNSGWVET
jgi:hypothetical protein